MAEADGEDHHDGRDNDKQLGEQQQESGDKAEQQQEADKAKEKTEKEATDTMINKVLESYSLTGSSGSTANLIQLPIVLSDAVTVHKTQGMTVYSPNTANMDVSSCFEAAQGYVALGRTEELSQVYRSARGCSVDLVDSILELLEPDKATVITGDFNICLDKEPKNVITAAFSEVGFKQLVTRPTHVGGGRIDHVYLRDPEKLLSGCDLSHCTHPTTVTTTASGSPSPPMSR